MMLGFRVKAGKGKRKRDTKTKERKGGEEWSLVRLGRNGSDIRRNGSAEYWVHVRA